jgi:L-malate glycosyltransferase
MKITYLASASSIHTAKWVNYLSKRGHQIELLSFEAAKEHCGNVTIHRIGRRWPLKMHYFSYGRVVRSLVRQFQPDIVHAHYASGYGTLGRLAGCRPYVISVWGSDIFDFPEISPIHRRIVARNLNCADRICSTSHVMAERIRKFCEREINVTPFGVDCEQFHHKTHPSGSGEFVVGIVKTLEPKYGIEYLLRGFAIFSKRNHRTGPSRLVIAGEGSLRNRLESLASDLGIASQTTFLGFVPHESVPEILRRLSVFVAPSISESESFGVAVIEASASGLPVVVSRIGGLLEVARDRVTGIAVPPRDPLAIANALEELEENEHLRTQLGTNGRRFVLSNFEWTENASRMERLYETLLAEQSLASTVSRQALV